MIQMPSALAERGIPLRGSALHIAYYVNCAPGVLADAVLGPDSTGSIEWRSPLATQRFAEYKDRDFLERSDVRHWPATCASGGPTAGPAGTRSAWSLTPAGLS